MSGDPLDPETGKLIDNALRRLGAGLDSRWRAILSDLCREVRKGAGRTLDRPTPEEIMEQETLQEREVSDLRERGAWMKQALERDGHGKPATCHAGLQGVDCDGCAAIVLWDRLEGAALSSWDGPEIKEG